MKRPVAAVVVLGDIGRSPRMCYHAHSLATQLNYDVKLVGYLDSIPHPIIHDNPNISYVRLRSPPDSWTKLPEMLQMFLKLIWTTFFLLTALLFRIGFGLELILMQNPPGLPTMPVCYLVAKLRFAKFVIDWHNYMYTVLTDKYGIDMAGIGNESPLPINMEPVAADAARRRKPLIKEDHFDERRRKKSFTEKDGKPKKKSLKLRYVEWVYYLEGAFGRRADAGLCVTRAMREDLQKKWGVAAATFYDRPTSWKFSEVSLKQKHDLLRALSITDEGAVFRSADETDNGTRLTSIVDGSVQLRENRPLVMISSTSWTPDEDFSILLGAVAKYDDVAKLSTNSDIMHQLPSIILVITGRGPLKDAYISKIKRMKLEKVEIVTPWLEAKDYPTMLAIADLGVSLHTSTSALDLPMKVVDMLCGRNSIPVLAKSFACIGELVVEGKNGRLFNNTNELSQLLIKLATGFPHHSTDLRKLKENVIEESLPTWEENWETVALPILQVEPNLREQRILARHPDPRNEVSADGSPTEK